VLEVGKLIHDRYALISPIGESPTALVWRANDEMLGHEVAIKFLLGYDRRDSKPGIDQFLREARLVASIQHRNVLRTADFGILDDRQPFMVMELLTGEDLGGRMAREPRLGAGPFIHVITVALRGLAALHDAGIVHRDLKPQNIFLQRDSDAIYPKILDFGIQPFAVTTSDGSIQGTPYYVSPEQARGQSGIDKRSDVYSIAVILFQGLSGRLPFEAQPAGELIAKITTEEPPHLRELCPDLPEPLSDLLAQAMSKQRDRRFADARAMRNAILSAAKTLLPATRRSSASLTPVAAPAERGAPLDAAQRAGWGDFEGLTRPAVPALADVVAAGGGQAPARHQKSAPLAGRHQNSAQLSGRHQNSAQFAAQRSSGAHRAVQAGAPAQPERTSVTERRERVTPTLSVAESGAESAEPLGANALDPLYAGADQAAPEIDFERVRIDTQKALPPRAQATAAQLGQASSPAGKQRGRQHSPDPAPAARGVAWRTWAVALIIAGAVAYYLAASGLASPAAPGAPGDPTATPVTSQGVDADLRKMRLPVKARRHKPGHMLPHLRDVEF
jgi:serine/threonine protein kinase